MCDCVFVVDRVERRWPTDLLWMIRLRVSVELVHNFNRLLDLRLKQRFWRHIRAVFPKYFLYGRDNERHNRVFLHLYERAHKLVHHLLPFYNALKRV